MKREKSKTPASHEQSRSTDEELVGKTEELATVLADTRLYKEIIDNSQDAVVLLDANGCYLEQNPACRRLAGYDGQSMRGKSPAVHLGDEVFATIMEELKEKGRYRGELLSRGRDDSRAWIDFAAFPVISEEGEFRCFVGIARDISERKRAEKVSRESEELHRIILSSISDAVFITDDEGRWCYVCPNVDVIFGYSKDEVWEMGNIARLLGEDLFDSEVLARHGEIPNIELNIRNKARHRHTLLVNVKKVEIKGGTTLFTCRDISERKKAERALVEAKEAAERANQAKSRFLATASHDLRQPMQTLALLNGLLIRQVQEPQARRFIEDQGRTLETLTGILNALLDLSRIETGGIRSEHTDFPVALLLEKMYEQFREPARAKGLRLRLAPSSAFIHSDPNLMERIVQNFVSNAIRYTQTGKVLVGCRRRGPDLHIEVWDTGVGIPETQQEQVFEAFYQADNPAREANKGLGLGLSIAQRLAGLLGHPLHVRSTLGKGSMFGVVVPLTGPTPSETPTGQETRGEPESLTGAAVLLIEDNPGVLEAMRFLLEDLGCRVVTATSGRDALALFENDSIRPDLILSDYRLPGNGDGLEVIRRIRKLAGSDLPALLLTGDISPESLSTIESSGIRALHKPVDTDVLTAFIRQLLGGGQ